MADVPDLALLAIDGLSCTIDGRTLWRDLALSIRPGERWAVVGPSGSGKTLLLRTLAALTPFASGNIRFAGKPLDCWWPPAYRAQVIYLAQRPVLAEGTVEAALKAPFHMRVHRDKRYSVDVVRGYLVMLGLSEAFLAQRTENLSGGEAQLAAVLRAILLDPSILLLDEPTASLDAVRGRYIEALVGEWLGGGERAYVWTSHDRAQLRRVSDRTLSLEAA